MKNTKKRYILYILIVIFALVAIGGFQRLIDGPPRTTLEDGWQTYGTDDKSIRADLMPGLSWSPYTMDNKAIESKKRFVWFRLKMPSYIPEDSYLQLYLNDNSLEVYYEGEIAYRFGDINQAGDRIAYGSPFHLIDIPRELEGKYLFVRMNAFLPGSAGIIRNCYIGTDTELLVRVIKSDIDNMIISIILVMSSFVLFLSFAVTGKRISRAPLYLAFASFTTGAWMFSETGIKQILYYEPRFWLYFAFITFFLIPIGYIKYCVEIFAENKFKKILNALAIVNVVYLILALLLDLSGLKNITYTLNPYLALMVFEMAAVIYTIVFSAFRGNQYAGLFVLGMAIICVLSIYDILGMIFHLVPWSFLQIPYGMFIFIFILLYILISHIQDMYSHEAANAVEIIAKNQELEALNIDIEESRNHLVEVNLNLEKIVAERTLSMQNLLDNAGQGFLLIGKNMVVDDSCSIECLRIFEKDVRGMDYSELIHGDNKDSKNYLKNVIQTILQLPDDSYNEKYLSLLPSEVFFKNKILDLKYKIIRNAISGNDSSCMVIITDVTESKMMRKKMEEEEDSMKSIVKVAAYTRDFVELTDSFRYFITDAVPNLIDSKNLILTKLTILRKKIHYYKGSFGIFGFRDMLDTLNKFEAVLKEMDADENLTAEKLMEEYKKFNFFMLLNEIMNFVSKTLSMEFKDRIDTVRINRTRIFDMSDKLARIPGMEQYAKEIRQLTYRDFYVLIAKYVVFTENLAEQLGKNIERIKVEGGFFLVDINKYEPFTNSLVHIFRNAVDHGIETDVERIQAGKRAIGYVGCKIEQHEDKIRLFIEDDGRGFNYQRLNEKAVLEGLLLNEESVSESRLTDLVLGGKVSTKDEVSDISGYGLGLSVVKDEVEKLNGRIEIESVLGKQTRIFIEIPLFD